MKAMEGKGKEEKVKVEKREGKRKKRIGGGGERGKIKRKLRTLVE